MILAGLRTVHDNCKLLEEQGGISMFRKFVIGALGAMVVRVNLSNAKKSENGKFLIGSGRTC
jgi:hypothetical protein